MNQNINDGSPVEETGQTNTDLATTFDKCNANQTKSQVCSDYVTVLTSEKGTVNKVYDLKPDGTIIKREKHPNFYKGTAIKIPITSMIALEYLLNEIAENPNKCVVLGFHPEIPVNVTYFIDSTVNVKARNLTPIEGTPGYFYDESGNNIVTTRTKNIMAQSSIILLDKDEDHPDKINQSYSDWENDIDRIIPGFKKAEKLFKPSNSSRATSGKVNKWHVFVKVKNSRNILSLGHRIQSTANSLGLGFTKITQDGKHLPRTLVDTAVNSPERIVYDGRPTIYNSADYDVSDLKLSPAGIKLFPGDGSSKTINTSLVKMMPGDKNKFKTKYTNTVDANGKRTKVKTTVYIHANDTDMGLDIPITIKGREEPVTFQGLIDNPGIYQDYGDETGKIRCQIPSHIRDSTSWNGILRAGDDDMPLFIDNGTDIKYKLPGENIADVVFKKQAPVIPDYVSQTPVTAAPLIPVIQGELLPAGIVEPPPIDNEKPRFLTLPNDHFSYEKSAEEIFSVIGGTFTLFVNSGGLIVKKSLDNTLKTVTPVMFQSEIESYCGTTMAYVKYNGQLHLKEKRLSVDKSKTLLESSVTRKVLPAIKTVSACPVMTSDGIILNQGYHKHNGGVLITHGEEVPDVPLNDAVSHLLNLHRDFNFTTPGDRSRAIAMMLTSAFKHSGLISTVCPVDIGEANDSQSGKTYRHKLIAAIYNNKPSLIAEKKGGVGSLDESISKKIIEGHPFVLLDNLRGRLDSTLFEAIITSPDNAPCRVPHKGEVTIDASLVTFQITSNGVEITRDMANRSCVVRIRKQPNNYQWHNWEGEELLEHVFKYQPYYLGCVFSIAHEWIRQGKPEIPVVDHDMRGWAKPMEWIIQNIFKLPPMLEGYTQIKEMVSNPRLAWLRQICLSAQKDNWLNREMYTHHIAEIAIDNEIKWPNGRKQYDNKMDANMAVGQFMKSIFDDKDEIVIDSFKVIRVCHDEYNKDTRMTRNVKNYIILAPAM